MTTPEFVKIPSKPAPLKTLIVFDDAVPTVLSKCVVPETRFVVPAPVMEDVSWNVTPSAKLTTPVLANTALFLKISSSNEAMPEFVTVTPSYVVGSETKVPALLTLTLMVESVIFKTPPTAFVKAPLPLVESMVALLIANS